MVAQTVVMAIMLYHNYRKNHGQPFLTILSRLCHHFNTTTRLSIQFCTNL